MPAFCCRVPDRLARYKAARRIEVGCRAYGGIVIVMTEFSLPSENLHKFKAFAGLALIAISLTIPVRLVVDLVQRANDLNVALGELEREVQWHTTRAGKSFNGSTFELADVPIEVARAHGRLAAQRKQIESLVSMERWVIAGAAAVVLLSGTALLVLGLRSWRKQQQQLDSLLDHQVRLLPTVTT